ncbi:MAG: BatD family protein [Epsilonproteobacteria bacterium]|nr:BatD family protein [Campylobacterota bacterium]
MKNLGRLFALSIFFFTQLYGATLTAKVDKKEVILGESVHLTIEAISLNMPSMPDIQSINGVAVTGKSQNNEMQFSSINGHIETQNKSTLELDFSPINSMTIKPISIEVDGEVLTTKPIDIVVKSSPSISSSTNSQIPATNGDFGLILKPSKSHIYMGESINLKIMFIENVRKDIIKLDYEQPAFKDFTSKQIGDEKSYIQNGRVIHEMEYLLTPKSAGKLKIEPAKVVVVTKEVDSFGFYINSKKNIVSQSIDIEVITPKTQTDLIGNFSLTDTIDKMEVESSQPVKLTIEISGIGDLSRWGGIDFEIDGVSVFAKDANLTSQTINGELHSTYKREFEFIAQKDFTIPSKNITVYDYKSGKIITLSTKSYTIKVKNATLSNVSNIIKDDNNISFGSLDNHFSPNIFKNLFYLFTFMMTIFILFKLFKKFKRTDLWKKKLVIDENEALQKLYPHISKSKEIEEMVQQLYQKRTDKSVHIDKKRLKALMESVN